MVRRTARRTAGHEVRLPSGAYAQMRDQLPQVADDVVTAIIAGSPATRTRCPARWARTSATRSAGARRLPRPGERAARDRPRTPGAGGRGAYQLGRGEARSGRTTEALLAAYRIGARVAWRDMSTTAVGAGVDADALVGFAELVFATIDELSAASVASHADELATTGRVRQRLLGGRAPPARRVARRRHARGRRAGRVGAAPHADGGDRARVTGATGPGVGRARHPPGGRPARARRGRPAARARRARAPAGGAAARWPTAAAPPDRIWPWLEVRAS